MDKAVSVLITAEAHLFVGVAKADGVIDKKEFAQIPYYAEKSQRFFDMMNMNSKTADRIGAEIRAIMGAPESRDWTAYDHLDKAMELIESCKEAGMWQTQVVFTKNEKGFTDCAKIGGYVIKEANYIHAMEDRLEKLHD